MKCHLVMVKTYLCFATLRIECLCAYLCTIMIMKVYIFIVQVPKHAYDELKICFIDHVIGYCLTNCPKYKNEREKDLSIQYL